MSGKFRWIANSIPSKDDFAKCLVGTITGLIASGLAEHGYDVAMNKYRNRTKTVSE